MNRPADPQRSSAERLARSAPYVLSCVSLLFAYRSLVSLGTRYGFATGVEYWLFRPTDNAPLVVICLSGWLVYRRWYRLKALPPATGPLWLVGASLCVALGFYAWAVYTSAADLQIFSLLLALIAVVTLHWGPAGLRVLWAPLAFLLFAIPMPAPLLLALVFKLQLWTADYAGWILHVMALPALVSGDQILRATQAFQVVEGCSGMRSLETLTMLSVLLVDLFRRGHWHGAILILLAPPIAFALNGFRVVTLILNPHSEIISIHNLQGIAILLVGLLIVYFIDGFLERFRALDAPSPGPRPVATRAFSPRVAAFVPAGFGLLLCACAFWLPVWQDPSQLTPTLFKDVSTALEEWPSQKLEPDFIFRGTVRYGQVIERRYEVEDEHVDVFAATADFGQRGGSPLSPITGLPGSGWVVAESIEHPVGRDQRRVVERVVEKGKMRLLLRFFVDGSRGLALETGRALLALDRSPLRRPRPILVARISTPIADRSGRAREVASARLDRVYARLDPALRTFLDSTVPAQATLTQVPSDH